MVKYKNESKGPINLIPKTNYMSTLTVSNYILSRQMIDQVLNEDHEYVLDKIKEMRTGGTMDSYFSIIEQSNSYENDHDTNDDVYLSHKRRKIIYNNGTVQGWEETINEVPKELKFPKDMRDEKDRDLVFPRMLNQNEQFRLLVSNLDEEQTNRFEVFHRTSLNKSQVKKLANTVLNQNISENIRVFLQSIGKIFAGEIIELALQVKFKWLVSQSTIRYNERKRIGKQLKKYLKKLTKLVLKSNNTNNTNSLNVTGEGSDDIGNENAHSFSELNDNIDECESDSYFDDDKEEEEFVKSGNELLKYNEQLTLEIKTELIKRYNLLAKKFNSLDIDIDKYLGKVEHEQVSSISTTSATSASNQSTKNTTSNEQTKESTINTINTSPLLPEHIREAWRLYQLQNPTLPPAAWRQQGEGNGWMFR